MSNTCTCPNPPGTNVVCSTHQVAYCSVHNGVATTGCLDPPSASLTDLEFDNWVLEFVTDAPRLPNRVILPNERFILATGIHIRSDGTEVRFSLPPDRRTPGGFIGPQGLGGGGFGQSGGGLSA